jgi:hypothetical protein
VRKLIAIALMLVLVITLFAVYTPNAAHVEADESPTVFESIFIETPAGGHPLSKGEVRVSADGTVRIEIEGAADNQTYRAFINVDICEPGGQGTGCPTYKYIWRLGNFTTNVNGDGTLEKHLSEAIPFPPASGILTTVRQPVFAIFVPRPLPGFGPKFVTGFDVPPVIP